MYQFSISKIVFILILLSFGLNPGCKKDNKDSQIPNVYVNFYVYLNDPAFATLNSVGQTEFVSGGVKGIIIHRATYDDFTAFDRISPYKPSDLCAVELDSTRTFAIDPCSLSKFSLLDGSIVSGPATAPLKRYQAVFDGDNTIHIFN